VEKIQTPPGLVPCHRTHDTDLELLGPAWTLLGFPARTTRTIRQRPEQEWMPRLFSWLPPYTMNGIHCRNPPRSGVWLVDDGGTPGQAWLPISSFLKDIALKLARDHPYPIVVHSPHCSGLPEHANPITTGDHGPLPFAQTWGRRGLRVVEGWRRCRRSSSRSADTFQVVITVTSYWRASDRDISTSPSC